MKLVFLFISIILGALGQVFLKLAATKTENQEQFIMYYLNLAKTPFSWLGALCYGLSFALWMRLLKLYDLSYLRPMVGLGYIITALLALLFFKEKITIIRWLGIILITGGIYLVGISAKTEKDDIKVDPVKIEKSE